MQDSGQDHGVHSETQSLGGFGGASSENVAAAHQPLPEFVVLLKIEWQSNQKSLKRREDRLPKGGSLVFASRVCGMVTISAWDDAPRTHELRVVQHWAWAP